jgi:hypothetical protein
LDLSIVQGFEPGALALHDFYFTGDDYRYRLKIDAKQLLIELLRNQFNTGIRYKGRVLKWDTVIEEKVSELGRFLTGRSNGLYFEEPTLKLERLDSRELRARVLALTTSQAKKLGIGKSTLHYLRKSARSDLSFQIHSGTQRKLTITA